MAAAATQERIMPAVIRADIPGRTAKAIMRAPIIRKIAMEITRTIRIITKTTPATITTAIGSTISMAAAMASALATVMGRDMAMRRVTAMESASTAHGMGLEWERTPTIPGRTIAA